MNARSENGCPLEAGATPHVTRVLRASFYGAPDFSPAIHRRVRGDAAPIPLISGEAVAGFDFVRPACSLGRVWISRRRVTLVSIALLLTMDLGRSLYARIGASTPTRLWSADPSYARAIAWPPGSDLPADASPGARVYARHCAICHGPDGHGNGPAAPSLRPRPRDFTRGVFKLKSTPEGQPPTLADIRATIRHGMPGSSMPGWDESEADIDAVATYILHLGPQADRAPETAADNVPPALWQNASADRGATLYADLGCSSCHGPKGHGDGPSAKDLKDVWNHFDPPRNLTAPWTFRGGNRPEALYARLAHGMAGTPMPAYAEVAEPQQIADVVAYVRSIARIPPWESGGVLGGPGQSRSPVRRGEYLVHAGMCGLCHTPVDRDGIYLADTHYLAGGMKVEAGAHGIFFTRNLTSDAATGLGNWSADQIATAIRTGHTPQRRLNYWGMPWMVLGALTDEDALAIATYLKTLPPVYNQIPLPLHYGFVETVLRKLTYAWPVLPPERLSYYAGDFGYEQPTSFPRDLPQRVLIWAQLFVLCLGLFGWVLTGTRARPRSRGVTAIMILIALGLAGGVIVMYQYPATDLLPTHSVVAGFAASIPDIKTDGLPPHRAALLVRGRYLYGIASCAYCHNGNGAGGLKVNWSVFGTTWTRNLTAHPTGLANWSDDEILRAMISGVGRDGRALHWQAMIWDHLSNYSVDDQHALLAYLRALPAVDQSSPAAVPPSGHDCVGDTFWIGTTNTQAGCE